HISVQDTLFITPTL
nr:immunoglobulin heavy chain junction region [Mus musculus]